MNYVWISVNVVFKKWLEGKEYLGEEDKKGIKNNEILHIVTDTRDKQRKQNPE